MKLPTFTPFFLLTLTPILSLAGDVQRRDLQLPSDAAAHKQDVVDIFVQSYDLYKQVAFGHDEVAPVSSRPLDPRNGWGASIFDGMSTMHIMGLTDLFSEALNFVQTVDFSRSKTSGTASVFETTIRYLGGLLSAYELNGKTDAFLIDKARQVADKMAFAWVNNNQVPFSQIDFSTNSPTRSSSNIAEAGTLDLEWFTLSKYTGNDTYRRLTEGSVRAIAGLPAPLPGLAAQGINPATTQFSGATITWSGGSDSYFEYLIKYARLTNTDDNLFADTWATAVDSSIKFLLRRSVVGNFTYLGARDDSGNIQESSSHLACFHGGNWIFGGKLLNNETIVSIGLELVDACWNTYASTHTGIGPEGFAFVSSQSTARLTQAQRDFNNQHGFYITSSAYIQRPEVLESNFYAWRATGDTKYLDRAAQAIQSFKTWLKVNSTGGFSGLQNVDSSFATRNDETQSFWFAEVLKYLYLTFDDPSHISLNDYVFNTEAHPIEAPPAKSVYGSGTLMKPPTQPFVFRIPDTPLPQISPIVV